MLARIGFAAVVVLSATASLARAEEFSPEAAAKTVAPFIDNQTFAVVRFDAERIKIEPLVELLARVLPQQPPELAAGQLKLMQLVASFKATGAKEAYLVASLADVPRQPPFLVVPLSGGAKPEAVLEYCKALPLGDATRIGQAIVAGNEETLQRLNAIRVDDRPELLKAFAAAGVAGVQAILLPTADHRRVVQELMPQLPEQFGGGDSAVVTRGLQWAALGVSVQPEASVKLTVQSQDAAAAENLLKLVRQVIAKAVAAPGVLPDHPEFLTLAKLLEPQLAGDQLTLSLNETNKAVPQIIDALKPMAAVAQVAAGRSQSMNNLKQLGLAMHNYHDVNGRFPGPAHLSADGKPLLSWRVLLLPYLDQDALYRQFRLDEPWDSEHNRKLIPQMPKVFANSASKVAGDFRTTYLAPIGKGTIWEDPKGLKILEITDGTSNTIMIVESDDQHAVAWTKPDDLAIDEKDPFRGLGGATERRGPLTSRCDGSVNVISSKDLKPEMLRALLTRDGGEVVNF